MGRNTIGGKKHKRAKNSQTTYKRLLQERQDGECYAKVVKKLGSCRLECDCFEKDAKTGEFNKTTRIAIIRGNMRKRTWINVDDLVLISLRGFQDDKCDLIWKFNPDEISELKQKKEIPNISLGPDEDSSKADICFGDDDLMSDEKSEEEIPESNIENIISNKTENLSDEDLDNI